MELNLIESIDYEQFRIFLQNEDDKSCNLEMGRFAQDLDARKILASKFNLINTKRRANKEVEINYRFFIEISSSFNRCYKSDDSCFFKISLWEQNPPEDHPHMGREWAKYVEVNLKEEENIIPIFVDSHANYRIESSYTINPIFKKNYLEQLESIPSCLDGELF